jgi:hypothetical protein
VFDDTYGYPLIVSKTAKKLGDKYTIEFVPNKYREVCLINQIDSTGIVDLSDYINRGIDLKTHEIYLNGKKLNKTQIDYLSPSKIRLKNVSSLNYLYILEKDIEGTPFYNGNIVENINDNIIINTDILNDIINETTPIENTDTFIIPEIDSQFDIASMITIYDEILQSLEFINPDEEQITEGMILDYPDVFDENLPCMINPNAGVYSIDDIDFTINPDIDLT